MTPEEFYETLEEKKPFTKLTNTGISDNLLNVFEFAKMYGEQLILCDVSNQRELLHKLLQNLGDNDELITNRTHNDIIDEFM